MTRSRQAVVSALVAGILTVLSVAGATLHGGRAGQERRAAASVVAPLPVPAPTAAARAAVRRVPPLRRLTPPDAVVRLQHPATAHQLRRLHELYGVRAVTVAAAGTLRIGGRDLRVLAVDLGTARGFTPRFTARSRELWTSVARGELTVDYSLAGRMSRVLGATFPAYSAGRMRAPLRIGAFASLGLGTAQGLVDSSWSRPLHLTPRAVVVVSAPQRSTDGLRTDLHAIFGERAHVTVTRPTVVRFVISAYARSRIPAAYLRLYRAAAATCRGLPWTVLAAIGTVETGNGANVATSSKGAMGPMQFLPSTFAAFAVDGDGDGVANIMDPDDAVYSAARYLCLNGAGLGGQALYAAIFAYNHADWYVREVIQLAIAYS